MALALSRQVGERLLIGDDIIIQVVEIRRGKVKLAISAPKDVRILREELVTRPPVADAACDVRGLAAADYETKLANRALGSLEANHKVQPPEDDQTLLDKMEDEQRGNC